MGFKKSFLSCFKNLASSGDEIFSDYIVEVGDKTFHCHRFVLSACSSFFRALFRCDMLEKKVTSIKLKDMSSETFHLIYRFLYFHENNLTEENFLKVWEAANFLQIDFILSACEKLALETINEINGHRYLWHARYLSTGVMSKIMASIMDNFDQFKDSECVMELEGEELMNIVKYPYLKTRREENVVDTVLKWVSYDCSPDSMSTESENKETESGQLASKTDTSCIGAPRTDFLIPILSVSRLTSLGEDYLARLLQHQLIIDDEDARELILRAKVYMRGYKPNDWPTFMCHRVSNPWEDVVVIPLLPERFLVGSMARKKMIHEIDCSGLPLNSVVGAHLGHIYACGYVADSKDSLSIIIMVEGKFKNVTTKRLFKDKDGQEEEFLAGQQTLLSLSVDNCVYVTNANSRIIYEWDPVKEDELSQLTSVPGDKPIVYTTGYKSFILIICDNGNSAELMVYSRITQTWQDTVCLDVMCTQDMASFYKKDQLYFLTSDGELFVVETVGESVALRHVLSVSHFRCSLVGAEVYCEDLFLFVKVTSDENVDYTYSPNSELQDMFDHVHMMGVKAPCTRPLPACFHRGTWDLFVL